MFNKIKLTGNWKFHYGDMPDAWYAGYDDSAWEDVVIPHDWSVKYPFSEGYSSGTGYLRGGIGYYRLHFDIPDDYIKGGVSVSDDVSIGGGVSKSKVVKVLFDGIYKNSQVWCNSYNLGKRPNGYVPIIYDITDFLHYGDMENVLTVKVAHDDIADSRWFTGSGITRIAYLLVDEPVHAEPFGVFFKVTAADGVSAEVSVSHLIKNTNNGVKNVEVNTSILDKEGNTVLDLAGSLDMAGSLNLVGNPDMAGSQDIEAHDKAEVVLSGTVGEPQLWSPNNPYLYTLVTKLSVDGKSYITHKENVGIRVFRFDADHGFFLNGENVVFKGVCLHHDGGCLGAAMTKEVWKRRLGKLKDMGCNAIRMSHNPHMPELYELCDEMGFLVMDEAFDEWENPKNKWSTGHNVYPPKHEGYAEDFPTWHEKDLTDMVLRDRNHPSVIMWSIGNEVDYPNDPYCHPYFETMDGNNDANKPRQERMYNPYKPNAERLVYLTKMLTEIVKKVDDTRPVTLAAAFPELSSRLGLFDYLDVVGYNYKEHLYEDDHARFPNKPFLGSENGHHYGAWKAVTDNPYIGGQFLWTGIDYLGEAHGWPVHGSGAGLLTLAGYEKPNYYKRKSFWNDEPTLYMVTCKADGRYGEYMRMERTFDYERGDEVYVRAYTNLQEISLIYNGKCYSMEDRHMPCIKSDKDDDSSSTMEIDTMKAYGFIEWKLAYEKGVLCASGTDSGGNTVRDEMASTEDEPEIVLRLWRDKDDVGNGVDIDVDAESHIYQVEISLCDKNGNIMTNNDRMLEVTVDGGILLGLESGDLADCTPYGENKRKTYAGRLIAYIRKNRGEDVSVGVRGEGLKAQKL